MKKVIVIGSDIVCKIARQLPKEKYNIVDELISVNPLSFVTGEEGISIDLPKVNREAYLDDLNNNIFDKIQEANADLIIIDLLDCRLDVCKYIFGDHVVSVTESNGLKEAIKNLDFKLKNKISPYELTEQKWFDVLKKYKTKLNKIASDKKIIVVDARSASTYLSKNKKIYNLFSAEHNEKIYGLFSKVYCLMRLAEPNYIYLPGFDIYFCDESEGGKVFSYTVQKEFYEYTSMAIDMLCDGASMEDIYKIRNEKNSISIKRYNEYDQREKHWNKVQLDSFCGIYSDDFGNYIDTGSNKINIKLNGQNNRFIIAKGCTLSDCSFELGANNYFEIKTGTVLKNKTKIKMGDDNKFFIGEQCTFDSVSFVSKSKNEITVGSGNKLNNGCSLGIDSNCKLFFANKNDIWGIEVHLFNYASLFVGDGNFFNKAILITCHSYTRTIIGRSCIFASEVEIINGDGHSIFDNITKQKINDMNNENNIIEVKDHVWLCRRAMLLSGSKVEQGCIIGAGAIVNKSFMLNNCLIAGVPAVVKRKNISWCRNNETSDIENCAPFYQITIETQEEK